MSRRPSGVVARLARLLARLLAESALGCLGLMACAGEDPATSSGLEFPAHAAGDDKTDVLGRKLAGVAAPYEADSLDEERLRSDMRYRREVGWKTIAKVVDQVPLLGLAGSAEAHPELLPGDELPHVPRFQTWYGIDDVKRMFQSLYGALSPAERAVHAPFSATAIDAAFAENATALDRSSRWPLERYLDYVEKLGECPAELDVEACARMRQSRFSGVASGNARIVYSTATVRHLLENYAAVLACLETLPSLGFEATPADEANFTACFAREMPRDAVVLKTEWVRADFGMGLPVHDTSAAALSQRLEGAGTWSDEGDREAQPSPDEAYTIRLTNGATYRLAGLHVMTKEARHWVWTTIFFSDDPDGDFGADRPAGLFDAALPAFRHYKMCVVADYLEADPDPAARFADAPFLADALRAVGSATGAPTWCSNPYVENGRHNARTNCIGCHQHGGSAVGPDRNGDGALDPFDLEGVLDDDARFPATARTQVRSVFPADYLWSFNRVDDLAHLFASEVEFVDHADGQRIEPRLRAILASKGDPTEGEATFTARCTSCHGEGGTGGFGPSLVERVPVRDDATLLRTIVLGRGRMPAWGETLSDDALRDLLAHLRAAFPER